MAADMAPAAVPGDAEPTGSATPTGPLTGMLASMLEPVDPARPTDANTASTPVQNGDDIAVGGSSASFHEDREEAPASGTGKNGQQRQGILRAWLLAGAARWHKGAGAHIKRLEVERAKHQARQVKETRQVTVNRSDGFSGKGSSRSGGTDKSLTKKNSSDGPSKGPRNSSGTTEPKPSKTKPSKDNAQKTSAPKTSAPGSGSTGKAGAAGRDGKNGTNGTAAKDSSRSTSGKQDKTSKGPGAKERTADTKTKPEMQPSSGGTGTTTGPKSRQGKDGAAGKAGKNGGAGPAGNGPVSLAKKDKGTGATQDTDAKNKPGQTTDKPNLSKDATTKANQQDKTRKDNRYTADGKPFTTRESREAGYRDGTRAAKAAAHVRAYRDGVKDGYGDTTEIANREKSRLDKAHEERKQPRNEEQEQPVSGTQTSADYHQPETTGPRPIQVKSVDATHVHLGDGAAREFMSRGEVRSLKSFERRLAAKTDTSQKVAEATKGLQAHALRQAAKVTQLREAAKAVEGGGNLLAALARLEEAAKLQAIKAEEIHKRAVRGAESCRVLSSNTETRYGGIYRAVVDSDETCPAELAFYKD